MLKTIQPFNEKQFLCEIYNVGFQLSFVSKDLKQCHPWVLCKDFLTDAVWATMHQSRVGIYGFSYDTKIHPPISLNPVLLMVRNTQVTEKTFAESIQNSCKFLNKIERKLKFKKAKVENVILEKKTNCWLFTLDKRWLHASPMISLLSLFMRVGLKYNPELNFNSFIRSVKHDEIQVGKNGTKNDKKYLKQSRKFRLLILKNGIKIFKTKMKDNYPTSDIHTIHNCWGIVSASKLKQFQTLWDLKELKTIGQKKEVVEKQTVVKKILE